MGTINLFRVILGGLVAGFIINLSEFLLNEPILGRRWAQAMETLNRPPMGGSAIILFVILGFALGIVAVYLYAAIRPRFGAGPRTAICAGLFVWFFVYLYAGAGMIGMGLFPRSLVLIGIAWGLLELPIATVFGAFLYKEA